MEPFKTRVEPERVIKHEEKPTEYQQRELTEKDDIPVKEFDKLEVWEAEKQKKYVNELLDTHEIGHEFKWKMPIGMIDKYIRSEMDERKYSKTIENYKSILAEIESELGTERMETWARIQRITGWIRIIQKQAELNKKKKLYAELRGDSL